MTATDFYNFLCQNGIEDTISEVTSMLVDGILDYSDLHDGLSLYCDEFDISEFDKEYFENSVIEGFN